MGELSIYEELLSLPGLKITRIEKTSRRIDIYGEVDEGAQKCPVCLESTSLINQYTDRSIRDLDISGRQVWLHLKIKQYQCESCTRFFSQQLSWADSSKSYTKRQAKWIFEMCEQQAFSQVGVLIDMHAKMVERVYYEYAKTRIDLKKRFAQVRNLGIDELSHRKGKSSYCCVLTDLDRGIHLDILPNRKKETLRAYFKELGLDFCAQIEGVSCDMWSPYIELAEECFPQANLCIDRFHVVQSLNDNIDRLRRRLRKKNPDWEAIKGIKWVLFKQPQNLNSVQEQLLKKAFDECEPLSLMYQQRNEFHEIFDTNSSYLSSLVQLNQWIEKVEKSQVGPYWNKFLHTLDHHKGYILNFVKNRLTNAATEGLNNLIRHIKRISFGIPNFDNMRCRILALNP